ncbi:MAG TPA: immunoglobulin domain-containing protein, partial [Terracidiphilus sp.]|nr:immunoglobulin domain-containing protein [Terracidiphilus sp.]
SRMRFRVAYLSIIASLSLLCAGCSTTGNPYLTGGGSGSDSSTVDILTQPMSQTVPVGSTATFTVQARGQGILSYQWKRNGADIDGATASSYTTPEIAQSDSGASFTVDVQDTNGVRTSRSAMLTAGPRAPKQGDLRLLLFQQATEPGLGAAAEASSLPTNGAQLFPGAVGSPLEIGTSGVCQQGVEYGCGWDFFVEYLPQTQNGLTMQYQGRDYRDFDSDLSAIAAPNVVITSLDFEPGNNAYAMAWVSTSQPGGFQLYRDVVNPQDIDATVAANAAASRITTAVAFDGNHQANLISYGWNGDRHTTYETRTELASPADVVAKATELAQAGYVITAFGGDDTCGYLLVGTRVQGDTLPRTLVVTTSTATTSTASATQNTYSTPVARFATDAGQTLLSEY